MRHNLNSKYAIIGLGTFGNSLAQRLVAHQKYVMAVDKDIDQIEIIKNVVTEAVSFDATNIKLLHKMGITEADVVIISIGDDFKSTEFIALELLQSEVPHVYVTVQSSQEEKILKKIGVTRCINTEIWAAQHLGDTISAETLPVNR